LPDRLSALRRNLHHGECEVKLTTLRNNARKELGFWKV
jgi:hypothetical protein